MQIEERDERDFQLKTQILTNLLKASKPLTFSKETLHDLISLYNQWEEVRLHEQKDEMFARKVAYTAARLSLLWRVDDSDAIAEILRFIYQRDSHFAIIFWRHFPGLLQSVSVQGTIFKIASLEDEESLKSLEYFLEHANKSKCTFMNQRFINFPLPNPFNITPTAMALIQLQTRQLVLLLQHGGSIFPSSTNLKMAFALRQLVFYTWIGIGRNMLERDNLISLICLGQINRILWDITISFDDEELLEILNERTIEDIKDCANILTKIVPQLISSDLEISSSQYYLFSSVEQTFSKMVQVEKNSEWNIKAIQFLTKLRKQATQISPLKHLCRCAIRSFLNEGFNLPRGVFELPVSQELQSYLSLDDETF